MLPTPRTGESEAAFVARICNDKDIQYLHPYQFQRAELARKIYQQHHPAPPKPAPAPFPLPLDRVEQMRRKG